MIKIRHRSRYSEGLDDAAIAALGWAALLNKPVEVEDLARELRSALGG